MISKHRIGLLWIDQHLREYYSVISGGSFALYAQLRRQGMASAPGATPAPGHAAPPKVRPTNELDSVREQFPIIFELSG